LEIICQILMSVLADGNVGNLTLGDGIKWIASLGGTGMMALGLVVMVKRWLITPHELIESEKRTEAMRIERDEWKALALRSIDNTEHLGRAAAQAATVVGENIKRGSDNGA